MRKFLIILPIICSIFCVLPAHADGDDICTTEPCQMKKSGGGKIGDCAGKPNGTDCTASHPDKGRTQIAVCISQSCTAIKCTNNNWLYWQKTAGRDLHSTGRCYSQSTIQKLCKTSCEEETENCIPTYDKIEWHKEYNKKYQPVDRAYCDHVPNKIPGQEIKLPEPPEPVLVPPVSPLPEIPAIQSCDLEFSDGNQLTMVETGTSAHKHTVSYNTLAPTTDIDPASKYIINSTETISNLTENKNIPHLFNLIKINDTDIDTMNLGVTKTALQNAGAVIFECHQGKPVIKTEPKPILTTETNITCKTELDCRTSSVFDNLDAELDRYFIGSSVWKNDQGKFNVARLASDSIAGVVLGTVGGVVTSTVMKKNQVKNGFENLKCTIGGQDVATFGDDFQVSFRQ